MSKKTKGISNSPRKVIVILCLLVILATAVGVSAWFLRKKEVKHQLVVGKEPFSNPTELRRAILDYFSNGDGDGDKKKREEVVKKYGIIKNWDLSQMKSLELALAGENVSMPLDDKSTEGLNKENLSKWDVSSVENMQMMCYGNKHFNNGTLMFWDVSAVKNMNQCFSRSGFVSDISKWNVSKVEDMYGIFKDSQFNIDISGWDVQKVIVWDDAFLNCPLGAPGNVNLLPPKFR